MADCGLRSCKLPAYGVHDGSKIVVCSPELADMFAANSPAEMIGRDVFALVTPEERDPIIAALLSSNTCRSKGVKLDGCTFPISVNCTPVRLGGADGRLFTVRDLSPVALVIDDEAPVARMTASLMRHMGYQVVTYTSAREAQADYEPGAASVIVTDIRMPEVDGIAMVKTLRSLDSGVPVIFVSGYTEEPVDEDAKTALVRKPFQVRQLQTALLTLPNRARDALT